MRSVGRVVNIVAAACACVVVLGLLGFGYRTIPALGPALDPGRGVWTSAAGGEPVRSQTLRLPGLQHDVTVSFSEQGDASIEAATDHDLFLALGYVHAEFRLAEMDEERRLGEGRLAQLAGPGDLASDKFELRLGLLRTAQQEWALMPKASPAAQALLAYAQGVNDDLARDRATGQWPAAFSLAGVYPGPWTPVDSLVIQGELTEELDFTTTPLDYALLERSLGAARTMDWFPVIAPDAQTPYDPGPYVKRPLTPLATDDASSGRRPPCSPRSAGFPFRIRRTSTRTATPGPRTAPPYRAKKPCWPATPTCRRRCRRSGTRRPCPRPAWTSRASPCRACPA
jgi:penicillin G amidase